MSRLSGLPRGISRGFLGVVACAIFTSTDPGTGAAATARSGAAGERRVTIFYTSGVQGTLEPCGCTSDPLGGIDRFAALVRRARTAGGVVLVDGGNLAFPSAGLPAKKVEAAELRAGFLARQLGALGLAGSALGGADLLRGPEKVTPARLAANLPAASFVEPSRIVDAGGIKIGLVGIIDPAIAKVHGLRADDPAATAEREARRLRESGADIVILLAAIDRPAARRVARRAAVDFVVLGQNTGDGLASAEAIGTAYLVAAAEEMQKVGRIDLVLRSGGGALVDAGGPEAEGARVAELTERITALEKQLDGWRNEAGAQGKGSPPGGEPGFVERKMRELAELRAERDRRAQTPWQPPTSGAYFTNRLIPLSRALSRDSRLAVAMKGLDRAIAKVNLAQAEPPPAADPGRARFVGDRKCAGCHKEATRLWRKTVHAQAWDILVKGGKQADLECVGCHVTGYGEVGGSTLGFTKGLESVQCETCHGPGSIHVAEEGLEATPAVRRDTPETVCLQCHTEKHSDTFDYTAYLRDIVGPGHGKSRRAALGAGPTGHELRHAALARASKAGADLKKKL